MLGTGRPANFIFYGESTVSKKNHKRVLGEPGQNGGFLMFQKWGFKISVRPKIINTDLFDARKWKSLSSAAKSMRIYVRIFCFNNELSLKMKPRTAPDPKPVSFQFA